MLTFAVKDVITSEAPLICQQVNCRGVMGAGVARAIRKRYPEVFRPYKELCDAAKCNNRVAFGSNLYVTCNDGRIIGNFFSQDGYGLGLQTHYDLLANSFKNTRCYAEDAGINHIAMPFGIGCGLAGGDWERVIHDLVAVFSDSPINVELCMLEPNYHLFWRDARIRIDSIDKNNNILRATLDNLTFTAPLTFFCQSDDKGPMLPVSDIREGQTLFFDGVSGYWKIDEEATEASAEHIKNLWGSLNFTNK